MWWHINKHAHEETGAIQTDTTETTIEERIITADLTETAIEAPSVTKILKFAIPAIGVWLCSPLLSLIGFLKKSTWFAAIQVLSNKKDYLIQFVASVAQTVK